MGEVSWKGAPVFKLLMKSTAWRKRKEGDRRWGQGEETKEEGGIKDSRDDSWKAPMKNTAHTHHHNPPPTEIEFIVFIICGCRCDVNEDVNEPRWKWSSSPHTPLLPAGSN